MAPPATASASSSRRATPLPPPARRRAIIDAAIPLMSERGASVTTRELAEAAAVAEGTIFNVFADKSELVDAVIAAATDPEPTERAIAAIDPTLDFEAQLVAATEILQQRTSAIWRLMSKLVDHRHTPPNRLPDNPALTALMSAHVDRLDLAPAEAARTLRSLALALTHPMFCPAPTEPSEIVRRFLYGCATEGPR